ncbi:MAG: hypothetical protein M1822_003548 [Bathelium mastoideum]|nr:MAG: hypothetical protein M1822_003548 [Bathelium mastoideum]
MTAEQKSEAASVPSPGKWPVDPQENVPLSDERIWVDGCFDFQHHGHAGAMLQARQLGNELWAGVHSDEEILENKGPTVMTLDERVFATKACRWVTKAVPYAPYVTTLPWITHYGCRYVVHGDDITSDSGGEDCYRFVKAAGRFKVVKRTPGISTTELVGRMLLCTKTHFIRNLEAVLNGQEGSGNEQERETTGAEMRSRIQAYATDESGRAPGAEVYLWTPPHERNPAHLSPVSTLDNSKHQQNSVSFSRLVVGRAAHHDQRVVYVDGGWDLFSCGHIEFLRLVCEHETQLGHQQGWDAPHRTQERVARAGWDYPPFFLIAGIHDDEVINYWKGVNYPIMNIYERLLCLLPCRFVHAVVVSAPAIPNHAYLSSLPYCKSRDAPDVVCHGPTGFTPLPQDPYTDAKKLGIFRQIDEHKFADVNAASIVERILKSRATYEERQRVKGVKGLGEEAVRRREEEEKRAEVVREQRLQDARD